MVKPKGKTSVAEGPMVEESRIRIKDNQGRWRVIKVTLTRRSGLKETAQLSWCRKSN